MSGSLSVLQLSTDLAMIYYCIAWILMVNALGHATNDGWRTELGFRIDFGTVHVENAIKDDGGEDEQRLEGVEAAGLRLSLRGSDRRSSQGHIRLLPALICCAYSSDGGKVVKVYGDDTASRPRRKLLLNVRTSPQTPAAGALQDPCCTTAPAR